MSHSKIFPGTREIPAARTEAHNQPLIPGLPDIPKQLRLLIRSAIAANNASLQTADLPGNKGTGSPEKRLFSVDESFYSHRTPTTKHKPSILIKGMVYHDGQVLKTVDSEAGNHEQDQVDHSLRIKKVIRNEIVHTRTHILQGVKTLVMAEWCFFRTDEKDPRKYGETVPPQPTAPTPLRYHNSILYTIHSTQHVLLDRYISVLQQQHIPSL